MSEYIAQRSRARIFMNWLAGALVALLVVGGFSAPAMASSDSFTVEMPDTETHNGLPVLVEGQTYNMVFGYGIMDDGEEILVTLPAGVSIPEEILGVQVGNKAVESLTMVEPGKLLVKFKNPFPKDGTNQGTLGVKFTLDKIDTVGVNELVWGVNGVPTKQTFIVTTEDNKPQNTDTWADKHGDVTWLEHTVVDGKVSIDRSVLETVFPYTVRVSSKDGRPVSLTDQLGPNLVFAGELKGTKVVRDANGMNPKEDALTDLPEISGTEFSYDFTAEANSLYTFTYGAKINGEEGLAKITADLQAAYDAVAYDTDEKEAGGDYSTKLTNGVTVAGETKVAETLIKGNVPVAPSPKPGDAFDKKVVPGKQAFEEKLTAGAKLDAPIDLSYTLKADLTVWGPFVGNTKHELKQNVVVSDTLAAPATWLSGEAGAPVLTDAAGATFKLTEATELKGKDKIAELIADNAYEHYYVFDGQNLFVNLGKDVTKHYTLTVPAQLDELPAKETGQTTYLWEFKQKNSAKFIFGAGKSESKNATTTITTLKDLTGETITDGNKFSKTALGGTVSLTSGESAKVPYSFKVAQGVGDAAKSSIVDKVDHEVFNVTEATLPEIKDSITGNYGGAKIDGASFDLSLDDKQRLVFTPNADFAKGTGATAPFMKAWEITFELPTHVFKGKQTLEVSNTADYNGSDLEYSITSSSSTKATSYGDEMEVRKHVYAGDGKFTTNFRAEVDGNGKLIKDEFTYRVELEPHGSFDRMVFDVVDVLPKELQFLGFVAKSDLDSGRYDASTSYQIPGSHLGVTFDETKNTLTVAKGKLNKGEVVSLFFKVRLTDPKENVGVTNIIGSSGATITPTNDYPLSLLKRDSADAAKLITDENARFSVLDVDKNVVLKDLQVKDGRIVTADGGTPVVEQPGTFWLREDTAPAGYKKTDELLEIGFKADDSAKEVVLFNDRENYAIGDFTWIDTNRDGIQDAGEEILKGVKVDLLQNGKIVDTKYTDDNGRYLFDELPAGEYQVQFTLTDEQQKQYTFTTQNSGKNGAVDSDAERGTGLTAKFVLDGSNKNLTKDYEHGDVKATEGIDPTWDAGVVKKTYAIGDFTWVDVNRDGIQDDKDEILPGVTVELWQGDTLVASKETDDNGHYLFDNLEAGEYEVKFILTDEQQKVYRFTEQNAGDDVAADSDADPKTGITKTIVLDDSNTNLTHDYTTAKVGATEGIDPTWDAGVIKKSWAIGDYTWIDVDRDGVQGEGDTFLPGVKVELMQGDKVIATEFSDENGRYVFDELEAGEYQVRFTLTDDQKKIYTFTDRTVGDDGAIDSNAERGTGLTTTIVVGDENPNLTKDYDFKPVTATEGIDPTWDAGVVVKTYAIGDFTWVDVNRDGIQDEKDEILPGVTVELWQGDTLVASKETDDNGHYLFDNLEAGEYEVKFILTDEQQKVYTFTSKLAGDDDAADSDADRKTGLTEKIVLGDDNPNLTLDYTTAEVKATEGIDPTWDAGVVLKSYAIGDVVWIDTNKNGIQDGSEKVLPGVKVELFKDGKVIKTATTDKNGRYLFDDLMAGEYEVKFTLTKEQQKVYKFTKQHAGDSDAVDSNADPKTGFTTKIVLNDDNANLTFDYEFGTFRATQGIDPTWDAGVIVLDIAAAEKGTPGVNDLPSTGGSLPLTLGGIALALLAAGGSLILWRRRTA
ncbi:SdrD B-like domain-containing protein [Leucobacter albus]|uniref:SdrD B-like domain-containing protein n=1 Tax=Leucobacter albus TaxID=272210 RepID=A0ABW3TNR3_9MICO